MSPAAEISIFKDHFGLMVSGTMGTYEPDNPQSNVIQTHFAAIPAIRFNYHSIYTTIGYGLNYSYTRSEIIEETGLYQVISEETNTGEFRINAGIEYFILPQIALFAEGGYAYASDKNQSYSAGGGITFSLSPKKREKKHVKALAARVPQLPKYKNISLVGYKDPILRELNITIESALLDAGTKVLSWERVSTEFLKQKQSSPNNINEDLFRILDPVQTAIEGARFLNIDAVIDAHIRYTYKSYGGKIIVSSASIRIINPESGNVDLAIEPDVEGMDYFRCKQEITKEILSLFKQ